VAYADPAFQSAGACRTICSLNCLSLRGGRKKKAATNAALLDLVGVTKENAMKKTKKSANKLVLNSETIRNLTKQQLNSVAGGVFYTVQKTCWCAPSAACY
jgi:hypothetical protein